VLPSHGSRLSRLVARLEDGIGGARGLAIVFVLALAQFAIVSVALPVIPGRDFGDYLWVYVQLGDAHSVFPMSMLFRGPVAPIVIGTPLDLLGGFGALAVMALLFALSVLAWVRAARAFGRRAALVTAVALLVFPAYTILFHELSSNAVFAAAFAAFGLAVVGAAEKPSVARFAVLGATIALAALTRPESQVLLVAAALPLSLALPWSRRLGLAVTVLVVAGAILGAWAVNNGVRYGAYTVARRGPAYLPFFRAFTTDHIVSPANGSASRELARMVKADLLTRQPYRGYHVTTDEFFARGKDREFADLLSLSDRVSWDSNYSLLRRAGLEAVRAHPGIYARGVARTFADELWLPLYVALPSASPAGEPASSGATGGSALPKPSEGELVPASNQGAYLSTPDNHIREVWTSPTEHHLSFATRGQERQYNHVQSDSARLEAKVPPYAGSAFLTRQVSRSSRLFPPGLIWLAIGLVAVAIRRPARSGTAVWLAGSAFVIVLVEALSDYTIVEFAVPLIPAFVVLAAAGLVGNKGRTTESAREI
jgi:hypothetical protein